MNPGLRCVLILATSAGGILILPFLSSCGGGGGGGHGDQGVPSVSIESPTSAQTHSTNVTPLLLGGTASDNRGLDRVEWTNSATGASGTATGLMNWTAMIDLAAGSNLVTVTAFDAASNMATDSITVTLDQTNPSIVITTPTTTVTHTTSGTPLSLAGTAADDTAVVSVTWLNTATGGSGTANGTTIWDVSITLAIGSNPITVAAWDDVGNSSTDSIDVTLRPTVDVSRAWGFNSDGQIGDQTVMHRYTPVEVVDPNDPSLFLKNVSALVGGDLHSGAVLTDGTVRMWGLGNAGQLGDGAGLSRDVPVQVMEPTDPTGFLTGVDRIALGGDHSVALKTDGTVWAWGFNNMGQIGDGTRLNNVLTAAQVIDLGDPTGYLTGIVTIAAGGRFTLGVKGDGTVWAWGENLQGQLGDDSTISSSVPIQVTDPGDISGFLQGVVSVDAGFEHSLGLKGIGTVWAWGQNRDGQLGEGGVLGRSLVPVQVTDPPDATGFLQGAIFIASGWYHCVAILGDNTVRAWGDGGNGQLGDGMIMDRSRPIQVEHPSDPSGYLTNVIDVDAGAGHTVSLLGDGTVRTWGSNLWGQLGDGTTIPRSLPVPVRDPSDPSGYLSGVADIDSGGSHVLARQ